MGLVMKARFLVSLVGVAMLAVPAAVPASQPEVRFTDLEPQVQPTASQIDLALLLGDPRQPAELSVVLPTGFTTLDAEFEAFVS